ncbi:MAG TPA: undecaprenyl-phosphate galactose phosphotransferase WbaP [Bacillota bacterium]|nr:undecaprenyl-phosphate galactose phosphotransferase WbaP [Bacillota bacterium]
MSSDKSPALARVISEYDEPAPVLLNNLNEARTCANSLTWSVSQPGLGEHFRKYVSIMALLAADYVAIKLAVNGAIWSCHRLAPFLSSERFFTGISDEITWFLIPLLFMGMIYYEKLYQRRLPFWKYVGKFFKACTFATLFTIVIFYFTSTLRVLLHPLIGFIWLFTCLYLITARYFAKRILVWLGLWRRPVIVVGNKDSIELLADNFKHNPGLGYQIAGVIMEDCDQVMQHSFPVIGSFHDLESAIGSSGVSEVVIALPKLELPELSKLVYKIQPLVKNVTIIPDLQGLPLNNLEADFYFYQKTVMLRVHNNLLDFRNLLFKRLFDLVLGLVAFGIAVPFMAIIALMIKLDSPGPVIHSANRLGKNGRKFKCYKFRTMYLDEHQILQQYLANNREAANEWHHFAKLRVFDPRITRVGKWLRKFSLDELPQIINVFKGEMSLVGPRPYLPREQERMGFYQKVIFETMPGITGLWQVRGRSQINFEGRLSLDSWYVRNWSLALDLILLLRTVGVVLKRKGAC